MAHLIRSAKSGSDWTFNELCAYNICITPTSPADFFQPGADPSLNHLDPSILHAKADDPNLSETTAEYLSYLDLATCAHRESAIDDFAAATLKLLRFPHAPKTIVATRYDIPLTICGEHHAAKTDVCIIYRPATILLVLVEDKTTFNVMASASRVDAQIVAEAIAAFQFNNLNRAEDRLPTLEAMTIPCITMSGTEPTFYLIPVTKELSDAVIAGRYPASQTQVFKCATPATHRRRLSDPDGMADLEFRRTALKRFLAFKDLAKSHWEQYMV